MTFLLQVDAERWRRASETARDQVADAGAELVPVAKGNGYGFGLTRLAREATRLGVGTLAVGTVYELPAVAADFTGDLLVMTPCDPADTTAAQAWEEVASAPYASRVIRTIGSGSALRAVVAAGPARVVVEGLTSMDRFGVGAGALEASLSDEAVIVALDDGRLTLEGLALHLPLVQPEARQGPGSPWHDTTVAPAPPPGATGRVQEALAWAREWSVALGDLQAGGGGPVPPARLAALSRAAAVWVSHLDPGELATLAGALPGVPLRARVGTALWVGDRAALTAYGTVLAIHARAKGDRSGYRQRRTGRDETLVVVAGGSAHGVALEAPTVAASWRQRAVAAGSGVLEAGGRALSPFVVDGKQRWFAEPPHMQVSLLRLPQGVPVPAVGDRLPCEVRFTTATFDRVLGLD